MYLTQTVHCKTVLPLADLRRRPEGAMAPLREETAIKKAPKLLLEGAKMIDFEFI